MDTVTRYEVRLPLCALPMPQKEPNHRLTQMDTDAFRRPFTAAVRISAFCFLLLAFLGTGCTKEAKKNRYLARANSDFAAGQYEKAEVEYRKVLQVAPANSAAIAHLGIIYHDQG